MNQEFEYYIVNRKGGDNIPLLSEDTNSPDYLYELDPVDKPKLMLFRLGKPVPKNPKMADYLSSPKSVISKKIFDVIAPLEIEGIQLLPARIKGKNNELFMDYWAIHIYHRLKCIDLKLSSCDVDEDMLDNVEKLVLDQKVLQSIPLKKRLVFRLKEDSSYELFHLSVVEAIMAVKPDGIGFTRVEEWNEESLFDD